MDFFVLLILHSTANRKKVVESLIRNKIKNGHFSEEMLGAAFNSQSQVSLYDEESIACFRRQILEEVKRD